MTAAGETTGAAATGRGSHEAIDLVFVGAGFREPLWRTFGWRCAMMWRGTKFRLLMLVSIVIGLAGCGPAGSLFPLFVNSDKEFDGRLLGEWRFQDGAPFKHGEDSGRMVFRKSVDSSEYEVTLYDFDAQGADLAMTAHLVRLGNYLFIDFGAPELDKRKFSEVPFPTIQSHMFGRIQLEEDSVRLDLLNDDWVKEQNETGKPTLAIVRTADGLMISAATEEMRKFALEHAEDAKVFSDAYSLSRIQ
jgi:hypothetical protein